MKKLNFKAFTLVEMLIVIVIIGILIAALLPRLQGAQGRARDVARKNSVNQIGTAIATYLTDHGKLPTWNVVGVDKIAQLLLDDGLINSIPIDPQRATEVTMAGGSSQSGNFLFIPMKKNDVKDRWFALVAKVETPGSANWVVDGSAIGGLSGVNMEKVFPCLTVEPWSTAKVASGSDGACIYSNGEQLRYVYFY